jgi:TonB family protein
MLQPLQLEVVSARYAQQIADLRDFLHQAGLTLGTAESLPMLTARLRDDRTFRRDLKSHVWVLLHADHPPIGYPDLLGVFAIAAAGSHFAAAADERDAHDLLRFLMEARSSFETVPIARTVQTMPSPAHRSAIVPSPSAAEDPEEQPLFTRHILPQNFTGDQKTAAWVGAATILLAAVLLGLWLHRPSAANQANTAAPITQGTPDPTTSNTPAQNEQQQNLGGNTAAPTNTKPRPATRATSHTGLPTTKPAAGTPVASTPPVATRAASASRQTYSARNVTPSHSNLVASANTPRLLRRQPAPARAAATPKDASDLVAKVQPIDLGTAPASGHSGTAYSSRGGIVRPTSLGVMAANVTYSPAPTYPPAASAAHVQGEVKLEAEIDADGNVTSTRVISGPPLLRDAAATALEHWRYRPYVADGKPIAMNAQVVMDFQLP